MSHEPIYERVRDLFEHDAARIRDHLHLPHYHHQQEQPQPAPEAPVSLATIEHGLSTFVEELPGRINDFIKSEAQKVTPHLTEFADTVDGIAQSRVVQTALSVVLGPADEEFIVGLMNRLDQGAHDAEAAAGDIPGDSTQQPAPGDSGVPQQPAEPVPAAS